MMTRGWPKGKPRKVVLTDEELKVKEEKHEAEREQAKELQGAVFAGIKHSGDPEDKKLLGAAYDESYSPDRWDADNPLAVPPNIVKANPGMRFRFRAIDPSTKGLRKGDHYQGWQVFSPPAYPDGVTYGGDLVLAFMPEEQAQRINERARQRSTELVRSMQEDQIAGLDRAAAEIPDSEAFRPGTKGPGGKRIGITVGASKLRNKATGAVTEQYRGYHPDELEELAAKTAEKRKKNRKYFT